MTFLNFDQKNEIAFNFTRSGDGVEYLSRPRYRPPTPMVIKKLAKNCNRLNFHQKNETAFIFTKEIRLKMNRTKKKVRQKTEIAFNFIRKFP